MKPAARAKRPPRVEFFVAALAPIAIGLALLHGRAAPIDWARNALFDEYQRLAPRVWSPDSPVRVIAIDEESLARFGQWPWPRTRLAELTDRLRALGAAVVVFDVAFAEQDRASLRAALATIPDVPQKAALIKALGAKPADADALFAQSLAKGPSAIGFVLSPDGADDDVPAKAGFAYAGDDPAAFAPRFARVILPTAPLAAAASGLGALNFAPTRDLIVRQAPLVMALGPQHGPAKLVPSLAAEALRLWAGATTYEVRASNASGEAGFGAQTGIDAIAIGRLRVATEASGALRVRYAGADARRTIPAWKVLVGAKDVERLAGRIALVGVSAAGLGDLRATPLAAAVPGVQIQAEAIETAAAGAALERPDYALGLESLALALGAIAAGWMGHRRRPLVSGSAAALGACALFAGSWLAFLDAGLLLDPLPAAVASLVSWSACTALAYRRSDQERRFVREAFSRYVSKALVDRLAADPRGVRLGGEQRELSVLFCDLRDFTRRAERMDAQSVVAFLNAVHEPMTRIVFELGGTVDKYLGDGLMAFWNAPLDCPDHARLACRAALAIHDAVRALDRRAAEEAAASGRPHDPIRLGLGLNCGDAFVGNIGSEARFDYSAVGDAVNTAARLEAACDAVGVAILASQSVVAAAPDYPFVELGRLPLKGKREPFAIFALHGPPAARDSRFEAFLNLHRLALAAFETGNKTALKILLEELADKRDAAPYWVFYKTLAHALKNPGAQATTPLE